MRLQNSPLLENAATLLSVPNLFNFWLTGSIGAEFTHATTTQCYDPRQRDWAWPLLSKLDIPTHIFPRLIQPGENLGNVLSSVAAEVGLPGALPVIAVATHDTGSAVAAVPAQNERFAWISSGTWSIVGGEVGQAVINEAALAFNFTNEGGVNDTFRFSKNVAGLWIVQECRRDWLRQGQEHSYTELTAQAAQAAPLHSLIDPDHAVFSKPSEPGDDMPSRVRDFCLRTGQPVPESKGALVRCVLESLALKYRWVLERTEEILGYQLSPLHIVGGGTQNKLLSQFTADATGRLVVAGPVEATALGNVIVQMMALGQVGSLAQGRDLIRRSFEVENFDPRPSSQWAAAYEKLLAMME
jgi:rhamnulokinase